MMRYNSPLSAGNKFSLLGIFVLLLALLLSACGETTSAPKTSSATTETSQTTSSNTNAPKEVTLTFGWWANSPEKTQAFQAWLQSFERTHPGIKIKAEFPDWTPYWQKLKIAINAGTAYDIVGLCSCNAGSLFNANAFLDLNQFSDTPQVLSTVTPESVKFFNWNNQQQAIPLGIALPVVGYNKDLFKAAGVPFPDPVKPMGLEEFKSMARKLTKIENGAVTQYALHPSSERFGWQTWVSMAGGQVFDNYINPTKVTVNTPEGIRGLTNYYSLIQEKIAVPQDEWSNKDWSLGIGALQTGKVAMAELGPWDFLTVESKALPVGVMPFPMDKQAAVRATANGLGIYRNSKYPKEAWEFLKWALQPENQLEFAKFSDIPVEKKAFDQLATVIKPKDFTATLQAQLPAFKPYFMSGSDGLGGAFDDIILKMERGLYTPVQAAEEMEKQGNAILAKPKN